MISHSISNQFSFVFIYPPNSMNASFFVAIFHRISIFGGMSRKAIAKMVIKISKMSIPIHFIVHFRKLGRNLFHLRSHTQRKTPIE